MTENLRESISALMDDEASELEIHRLLSSMEQSNEVRDTWKRYQMASLAIKGKLPQNIDIDISGGVAQAIANDEIDSVDDNYPMTPWGRIFRPFASVAVAASVAFAVVFGALQVNNHTESGATIAERSAQNIEFEWAVGNQNDSSQSMAVTEEALTPSQQRLKDLIDSHTQQADLSRSRAFMPYAQLVSDSASQRY